MPSVKHPRLKIAPQSGINFSQFVFPFLMKKGPRCSVFSDWHIDNHHNIDKLILYLQRLTYRCTIEQRSGTGISCQLWWIPILIHLLKRWEIVFFVLKVTQLRAFSAWKAAKSVVRASNEDREERGRPSMKERGDKGAKSFVYNMTVDDWR